MPIHNQKKVDDIIAYYKVAAKAWADDFEAWNKREHERGELTDDEADEQRHAKEIAREHTKVVKAIQKAVKEGQLWKLKELSNTKLTPDYLWLTDDDLYGPDV